MRFGYQDVMSAQSAPGHFILSPLGRHAVILRKTSWGLSHRCWGDESWAICLDCFTPAGGIFRFAVRRSGFDGLSGCYRKACHQQGGWTILLSTKCHWLCGRRFVPDAKIVVKWSKLSCRSFILWFGRATDPLPRGRWISVFDSG